MPEKTMGLLYFGRLDDEKGFGLILEMLHKFIDEHGEIPFSFYVFGKGKYVQDLLDLAAKYNSIHFFGRQSLETIQRYQENCQFCLMPSTFLETFGLTAVNALHMGIPVVGFAKGGLKQFIPSKYDISKSEGKNDREKLYNKIKILLEEHNAESSNTHSSHSRDVKNLTQHSSLSSDRIKKAKILAKKYSKDKRIENIQEIIGKPKKILLITDFKTKLGGIETYVHDVKNILATKGYQVKIYGASIPSGKLGQLIKYFGLFFAMRNFIDAIRLKILVRKFKPKVIRYHSTLRRMGRLPIKALSSHNSKKIMMYHDLGYFHPFPSCVLQENMVKTPVTLRNFITSSNTKNPIKVVAIAFKYLSIVLLKKQLKKSINYHLVPSKFMEKIVTESYHIPSKKVQTLSHFIQD